MKNGNVAFVSFGLFNKA